ncbi:MAG: GGDEF domain-containing protein [Rubrivivax sp.]
MPSTPLPSWLAEAWQLSHVHPSAAHALATRHLDGPPLDKAWALLQLALADAQVGSAGAAAASLARAGEAWEDLGTGAGVPEPAALLQWVADTARARAARQRGDTRTTLRHGHAASDAAARSGLPEAQAVALLNLGAAHHESFNLDDARRITEQGLAAAQTLGAPWLVAAAAARLTMIDHAAGTHARSLERLPLMQPAIGASPWPASLGHPALAMALAHLGAGDATTAAALLDQARTGLPAADGSHGPERLLWHGLAARCLLLQGQPADAASLADTELQQHEQALWTTHAYPAMQLLHTAAEAHEQSGQPALALARLRQAQPLHELLMTRRAQAQAAALLASTAAPAPASDTDAARRLRERSDADSLKLQQLQEALLAKTLENERLQAQLLEQALHDGQTGLHNRRYLFEAAPALLHRASREQRPLSVAMLDLDHFKPLNDEHGHEAGDAVLQRFSALLRGGTRASDLLCRLASGEFVLVCDGTPADAARSVLERMLAAWQALPQQHEEHRLPPSSFSGGVVAYGATGTTLEALLSQAERALRAAKTQGRARVQVAEG